MKKSSNSPFRLPDYIRPSHYHLVINPDLVAQTYSGNVTIDVDISKKTNTIFLHAKDLTIASALIRQGKIGHIPKIKHNKKDNYIELTIEKKISGKAEISLTFNGIIHSDLRGFYISKYDNNGTPELIGTTQFEAIDARRAFPCFDEPDMKAVFSLEVITEKDLTVLGNTEEIKKTILDDKKVKHTFARTPKMSTYLLAWCIGKFETLNTKSGSGIDVRVHTSLGKKDGGKFALGVAAKCLNYFEDFFGIKYPLKKLDLVALPDFAAGAMENWGLINFRETCLLVDKKNTALTNQQFVAVIIAHEIAHQWFGNLVTMAWWDDLWLNEGFANYIEYACVDAIYPEWKIWEDFTHGDMGDAFRLDALESSHPIQVEIEDAHDIDEIFDDITYRKGATVIRMLAEYVGQNNFQKGIRSYMKAYAYKNATTKNLWMHLEKASKKPVSKVMGAWTRQAGFPIITMNESKNGLVCSQCRYYRNRNLSKKNQDKTTWPIPLNDGTKNYLLENKKTNTVKISKDALTLNYSESNLVHIDYSPEFVAKQKDALLAGKMTPIQKMGLIRNIRALAENGSASVIEVIEFINLFRNETHYLVLSEMWGTMMRIMHIFGKDEAIYKLLEDLYKEMLTNMWKYVDYNSTKRSEMMRSSVVLSAGYKLGYEPIVTEALNKFQDPDTVIPPHMRSSVYRTVVKYGDEKTKAKLWIILEKEKLQEEKLRIMSSFSAVVKARDLIDVLGYYNSDKVRKQDTPLLMARLLNETNNPEIVWNYVEHHWGELLENYGKGGHLLTRILGGLSAIRDDGTMKHMKAFFKKYPAPGARMTLNQVYEKIEGTILYYKSDARKLETYLRNLPKE